MTFESVGRPGLLSENASIAVCLCANTFSSVQASIMLDAKEIFALVDTVPSEDTDIGETMSKGGVHSRCQCMVNHAFKELKEWLCSWLLKLVREKAAMLPAIFSNWKPFEEPAPVEYPSIPRRRGVSGSAGHKLS
jgi:hypothetical protein